MRAIRWMVTGALVLTAPGSAQQVPQSEAPEQVQRLDQDAWITGLLLVNKWAVEASLIAQRQASTKQARQFASEAVQQHSDLQRQLEQLAQQENIDVAQALEAPEGPRQELMNDALVTSLRALPQLEGANLDRAYLSAMVLAHDLAVDRVTWALGQVQDPKLTRAARDALTTLSQQRRQAWELLGSRQLVPKATPVGQARRVPSRR